MRETHTPLAIQIDGQQVRIDTTRGVVELLDPEGRVSATHPIQAAAGSVQGEFEDDAEVREFFE